jgi:rhodanese-related sulfurtransferase
MLSFLRSAGPRAARISAADAIRQAREGTLTLIDVREAGEVSSSGKAAGALHIPLGQLAAKADPKQPNHDPALSPDKAIALYCASGARSQRGADLLVDLGYTSVFNLGGFGEWCAAGGKVVR